MILTNEALKKYYFGAYEFKETEDGYLQSFQYSEPQIAYFKEVSDFWYERCTASTSKTLEFETAATAISFDYRIIWMGSPDSIELTINGLIHQIYYVKDIEKEGRLTFNLPEGSKKVVIYLPADATALIKDVELNATADVPQKAGKVLWLGDSITQGYGPLRTAHTYVSVANRYLNYDIINQGIGGYVYDKKSLMEMPGYQPDKIFVALGTNQYGTKTMVDVEEYYERLIGIYGNEIPIICITPIWRGDSPDGFETLKSFCEKIKSICVKYKNIQVIEGFQLVPHLSEYYLDNLHPNVIGAEMYGRNLVMALKKL